MVESLISRLSLQIAQLSKLGGRQSNEDAYRYATVGQLACFAVSDGVGGEEGGEVASRIVVDTIVDRFEKAASVAPGTLTASLQAAAEAVTRGQRDNALLERMSATAAALVIDCNTAQARWSHLGDSRVYLFRRQKLHRMTRDHSAVQQLVDAGYCSPSQIRSHPLRSSLLAAVGLVAEGVVQPVEEGESDLQAGDAFLVCSDGFWEWLTESDMAAILAQVADVDQWLAAMEALTAHNAQSSTKPRDNYTAFAVFVGER